MNARLGLGLLASLTALALVGCVAQERQSSEAVVEPPAATTESNAGASGEAVPAAECPCGRARCPGCRGTGRGAGLGLGCGMGTRGVAGPGRGPGQCAGGCGGPGRGLGACQCEVGSGPLDAAALSAIERALDDERRAEDRYRAAVAELGRGSPVARLERAEGRHSAVLERVLSGHGAAVPARRAAPPEPAFGSVSGACQAGERTERENVALYDELLKGSLPDDVRCVFQHLRSASKDRHLPALERCSGTR